MRNISLELSYEDIELAYAKMALESYHRGGIPDKKNNILTLKYFINQAIKRKLEKKLN